MVLSSSPGIFQKSLLDHVGERALGKVVPNPREPRDERTPRAKSSRRQPFLKCDGNFVEAPPRQATAGRTFHRSAGCRFPCLCRATQPDRARISSARHRRSTPRISLTSPIGPEDAAEPSAAGRGASAGDGSQRRRRASVSASPWSAAAWGAGWSTLTKRVVSRARRREAGSRVPSISMSSGTSTSMSLGRRPPLRLSRSIANRMTPARSTHLRSTQFSGRIR